jgi:LemA protein
MHRHACCNSDRMHSLPSRHPIARLAPALLVCGLFASGCGFNTVIQADEAVKGAWAEVESQYQRRSDLIPNLVATVKGSAKFEQDTLTKVVEARAKATGIQVDPSIVDDPERLKQFEEAQQQLSGALSRLIAVSEAYPDLKASAAFRDLMAQLEGTENRIAVARGRYIESVAGYNTVVQTFPSMIGAKLRKKSVRSTFQATTPGSDVAPKVDFGTGAP